MKDIFNLPNILTLIRIILSPVFLIILSRPDDIVIVGIVLLIFIIASITDYYDGVLARKYNDITNIGKILDPIADKLMISFALYSFVKLGSMFWWVAVIIFSREIIVTLHRFYLLSKGEVVAAIKSGKWKTGFQITMVIALLIWMVLSIIKQQYMDTTIIKYLTVSVYWIAEISIWGSLLLTIYSGIEYIINLRKKQIL